jgi:hypothetical protein
MEATMSSPRQRKTLIESVKDFDIRGAALVMPVLMAAGLWYHSQYFVTKEEYNQNRTEDREFAREMRDDLRDIKNHLINKK